VLEAAEAHRLAGATYVGLNQAAEARMQLRVPSHFWSLTRSLGSPRLVQVRSALQAIELDHNREKSIDRRYR